jgi:hypothetical protein
MLSEKLVEEYFMTTTAPPHVTDSTERAALQQQQPTRLNEQAADLLTKPADQTQHNLRPTDKNFQDPVKLSDQVQMDFQANKTLSIQDRAQMEESIKIADKLDQKWIGEQLLAVNNKLAGEMSPQDKANVKSTRCFWPSLSGLLFLANGSCWPTLLRCNLPAITRVLPERFVRSPIYRSTRLLSRQMPIRSVIFF